MKSGLDAMPLFLLDDLLKAFLYFWFAQNWMPNQPNLFLRPCSITKCVTRISFSDATHYITKAQKVRLLYHRVFDLRAESEGTVSLTHFLQETGHDTYKWYIGNFFFDFD